ncbi:MAG: alpha/beta fold hydrolase [Candidatus Bipolaricaulota bacterium]
MARSVFRSEEGRRAVVAYYERILGDAGAASPFRRRTVETSLGKTHLLEAGPERAPALLLLHGTASNSATWLGDLPFWAQHFRVLAADIPGEPGLSEDRRLTLASDEPQTWLRDLLDALGLSSVHMVGLSLGGWMALRFATREPERVQALSLLSAGGLAPQKRSFLLVALPLSLLGAWGLRKVNRIVCRGVEIHPEVEEFMALVGRHFRPLLEPIPVFRDEELARLTMPIQSFAGGRDALLHSAASVARIRRLLPHAEAHLIPNCGHAVIGKAEEVFEFQRRVADTHRAPS